MDDVMKDRIEQLVDFIMKWCLWQFHSRTWDRERQNEGILTKTMPGKVMIEHNNGTLQVMTKEIT